MTHDTERFVTTGKILAAIKGLELGVLDALSIPWQRGRPHIHCPYPYHADNHPSWRWDGREARAYCTCHSGGHSVLDVVMSVEGIDFDQAKIRAAELLNRSDLIQTPLAGCTLAAYAMAKRLPIEFLQSLGLSQVVGKNGKPQIKIPYFAMNGSLAAVRYRVNLERDQKKRFLWEKGATTCLYGLNRITEASKAGFIVLCEGESDVQTLWLHDIPALGLPGATNWNETRDAPLLADIPTVYVILEPDKGGDTLLARLGRSAIARKVRLVRLSVKDASDLYLADPIAFRAAFTAALDAAESYQAKAVPEGTADLGTGEAVNDAAKIERLANLPPLAYERERKAAAEQLGISRVSILDGLVAGKRSEGNEDTPGQGRPLNLAEPIPWPAPVDGAELLDELTKTIRRFVVLSETQAHTVALWVLAVHAFDAWRIFPRLFITAPEKGCGKTTTLDVLSPLTPRSLTAANIKAAPLFRVIELVRPTLLLDEADSYARTDEDLRSVLDAGHHRDGAVLRCVGEYHEPRQFSAWAPVALAAIGRLPGTIEDRSIIIRLRRRRPDEAVQSLRGARPGLEKLARMAARWAGDHAVRLAEADPGMPEGIINRLADNWHPLLAVADLAGGDWPAHARRAAIDLAAESDDQDSARVALLSDIRAAFAARTADRIASEDLVAYLGSLDDRPWPEFKNCKPITKTQVARLLKPMRISSGTIRLDDGRTAKGYYRRAFDDAFERYLPAEQDVTTSQPLDFCGFRSDLETSQEGGCDVSENLRTPSISAACDVVTDRELLTPEDTGEWRF